VIGEDVFQVVADRPDIYIVEHCHHFLAEPDIFIRLNGRHTSLAAGRHKGEVFRR
jgi:hypothetical protein